MPPPQTLGVPPPPHVWGGVQVPQSRSPPQPSATGPQFAPTCWHVSFVQFGEAHWFEMPPPPHVAPFWHVPQTAVSPPQPSAT
jgi:hypothetical protein